jgi:phospholipid/cholesterol/gamma-HCH transport system substrate-binding protein
MIPRIVAGLMVVVVLIAGVLATQGDEGYEAVMVLDDALGLRDGSKVVVGGVEIGRVDLDLDDQDRVIAHLKIKDEHAPIGRGASATVNSINLLGQKSLELQLGDVRSPMPSGSRIPASRVTPSTDLDQVLNVLDTDTRARLTILLNEAGAAFAGRRFDVSKSLQELPTALTAGRRMLDRLVADGRTLGSLVRRADGFTSNVASERRALGDLLDKVGRSAETAVTKRVQLRSTLQRLPETLATARSFLDELRATAVPLGPAARNLRATARPLASTLDQLRPFTKAATPALEEAVEVAPKLTQLASGATPVLRRAQPVLGQLASFSSDLIPVTDTLNKSSDNIIATVANWTHAIQFRDGLGHVFRAEVGVTPQTLNYFLDRLGPPAKAKKRTGRTKAAEPTRLPALPKPSAKLKDVAKKPLDSAEDLVDSVTGAVLERITGLTNRAVPKASDPETGSHLLDFLLRP